ncbi:MAG: Cys/Met metabolism pyridoxal-phosphate-dependent enzyme [Steroidobacteraceae bacterium]|nr:Cys/Met metabolism pyridoxal-phosphate-dependent enzyme [Steroidobacteraceae bacterium]
MKKDASAFDLARELSPRRNTTHATAIPGLVEEQLRHFSIDPQTEFGRRLGELASSLYAGNAAAHQLWDVAIRELASLEQRDRVARFNAKRFLCFQLAKILDTLQNPLRKTYQSLLHEPSQSAIKGPYPIFDNVTALFSATPVIARTATYLYACTEWVEDAFKGREPLLEIYSRLLNPTSISLANHIVDLEAGALAGEYLAWNFNSGMAAIDTILANLVGFQDVVLASRNVYGGTYQLLNDWYGKKSNLDVAVEWFDGFTADDFCRSLDGVRVKHRERLERGRGVYVFVESPCNPHGYVLDVPAICRAAHELGLTVIVDATVGTPVLQPVLRREDPLERPDFVIHSYTKDLAGAGTTTAGVCIGRNERMFIPKGDTVTAPGPDGKPRSYRWDESLFWNVYYVKGAFLDADKAFEVINGMRTVELRVLQKAINTTVLARALAWHPAFGVRCGAVEGNENFALRERLTVLGLPAPLFTIDLDTEPGRSVGREAFQRFFDCLEPAFGLQVTLGQSNTVVVCPALTSHSELSEQALRDAGITPTTIRISVGDEDPRTLLAHLMKSAEISIEPAHPGFMAHFAPPHEIDSLYESVYVDVHRRLAASRPRMKQLLS